MQQLAVAERMRVPAQREPVWEQNENGHLVVSVLGRGYTGVQERMSLRMNGHTVNPLVASCLTEDHGLYGFDSAGHQLEAGVVYKTALVRVDEVPKNLRTTADLRAFAMERYGYGKPVAGLILRMCAEKVSVPELERLAGITCVAALNDPLRDGFNRRSTLVLNRYGVFTHVDESPEYIWPTTVGLAFQVID